MHKNIDQGTIKLLIISTLIVLFFSYSVLVYTAGTKTEKTKFSSKEAAKGKLVFQKYNCISCHQLYGLGGYMGPDLTNVISSKGKGEHYAKAFIKTGTAKMPNFNIPENEINALVEFLNYVDKTGRSPHFELSATLWGDITETNKNESLVKTQEKDSLLTLRKNNESR